MDVNTLEKGLCSRIMGEVKTEKLLFQIKDSLEELIQEYEENEGLR